jgi:transcriptional regulator GlxA family with amidase domain
MKNYLIKSTERRFCPYFENFYTEKLSRTIQADNKNEAEDFYLESLADDRGLTRRQIESGIRVSVKQIKN